KFLIPACLDNARKWQFVPNRQKRAVIVYEFQIHAGVCHDRTSSVFLLTHHNIASIVSCENVIEGYQLRAARLPRQTRGPWRRRREEPAFTTRGWLRDLASSVTLANTVGLTPAVSRGGAHRTHAPPS